MCVCVCPVTLRQIELREQETQSGSRHGEGTKGPKAVGRGGVTNKTKVWGLRKQDWHLVQRTRTLRQKNGRDRGA